MLDNARRGSDPVMFGLRWRAWLGLVPRDLEGFAALAQARLQELRGESSIWSPEQAILRIEGDDQRVIALARAYEAYRAAPRNSRGGLLDRLLAPPPPLPDRGVALPNLLPAVRNRYRFANELRQAARHWTDAPAKVPPMRPIAEHLGLVLVHDEPDTVSLLGQDQLHTWAIEFDDALNRAIENLRALSDADWTQLAPGLFASPWSDFHDAARLALPDLFHRLPIRGNPVATVPNRQAVLVAGDKDLRAMAALLEATRTLLTEDRPISGIPVRHDGQRWESWAPDAVHPELGGWSELRAREIGAAYKLQRELMGGASETETAPPVVAVPVGAAVKTGCYWPETGVQHMPAVDLVLFEKGSDVVAISLPELREKLPHLLERTDAWPPRWRTVRRPTPEELEPFQPVPLSGLVPKP